MTISRNEPDGNAFPGVGKQVGAGLTILAITAIWGGTFPLMKNAMMALTPLYLIFIRFTIATTCMLVLFHRRLCGFERWMLKPGLMLGIAIYFGFTFQTYGLTQTTASNTAFITGSYVVFVPLLAWFRTKQLHPLQFGLALTALLGIAVLSLNEQFRPNIGDVWVLCGALAFAVQILIINHYTRRMDSFILSIMQLAVCMVLSGISALILEPWPTAASFNADVWIALLYCAFLATAFCYSAQVAVQKVLTSNQASILLSSESIFGALFGWLLLGELFSVRQFCGAAILFASMIGIMVLPIWQERRRRKHLAAER